MTGFRQHLDKWGGIVSATLAASAVLSALLTYAIAVVPSADPPGGEFTTLRWIAVWLMFTLLIALMLAAGIWRMTWRNDGGAADIPASRALMIMAGVIAVCALSVVPIILIKIGNVTYLLYGVLAIALALGLAIARPWRRRSKAPPNGGASI